MRTFCVALVGAAALTGCSMTVAGSIPDAKGHTRPYALHFDSRAQGRDLVAKSLGITPIFAPALRVAAARDISQTSPLNPSPSVSVADIAGAAVRIPAQLDALRRDITILVSMIVGSGVLGAVFFAIGRWRRAALRTAVELPLPAIAATAEAADGAPPSDEPQPTDIPAHRCACSAEISARSRTGRCRRCARQARANRRPVLRVDFPATLAAPSVAEGEEPSGEPVRATLALSRIGKQRQYYVITGDALTAAAAASGD